MCICNHCCLLHSSLLSPTMVTHLCHLHIIWLLSVVYLVCCPSSISLPFSLLVTSRGCPPLPLQSMVGQCSLLSILSVAPRPLHSPLPALVICCPLHQLLLSCCSCQWLDCCFLSMLLPPLHCPLLAPVLCHQLPYHCNIKILIVNSRSAWPFLPLPLLVGCCCLCPPPLLLLPLSSSSPPLPLLLLPSLSWPLPLW